MTNNSNKKSRREFIKTGLAAGSIAFVPWNIAACDAKSTQKKYSPEHLKEMGLLDITLAPYLADPKGKKDSTSAIQLAVNDARDLGLVCFFPEGTYLVSETISVEQQITPRDKPYTNLVGTRHFDVLPKPMIMMGSTKGKRPVIKLSKEASGFDDPENPKKVIWIWAQSYFDAPGKDEPEWGKEQGNISFNHLFMNIDIDIRGHAGAIGIRHSGSQGSAMMNSTIFADGAYSGMSNCCGQGGGTYNMEVIGGEHGIVIDSDSRFPTLVSCEFKGQRKSSVAYSGPNIQVPSLFAGCRFAPEKGNAIEMSNIQTHGGLLMVDCMFELNEPYSLIGTNKKENIFIENSYAKGADRILSQGNEIGNTRNWQHIEMFSAHTNQGAKMVNGETILGELLRIHETESVPEYATIQKEHFSGIPSFEDDDVVNVKDFGAVGDGFTDDTEAFRKAIARNDKVFVPKGHFKLSGNLELRENTQIFSLSKLFSSFGTAKTESLGFSLIKDENSEEFSMATVDSKNAAPGLYLISPGGKLKWRSGRGTWFLNGGRPDISENGGGRFYGAVGMVKPFVLDGITQPTAFYALNVERVHHEPQSEIRNCKNVRLFYFKVEAGTINSSIEDDLRDANTPCRISNSENISIYCMTGVVLKLMEDQAMIRLEDSENIKLAHIKSFKSGLFPQVREIRNGDTIEIPANNIASLFIRE